MRELCVSEMDVRESLVLIGRETSVQWKGVGEKSVKYEAEERSREQNLVLLHRTSRDRISC